jgi:6-phosphogluconolactonase (cycloisomerase 2 family)
LSNPAWLALILITARLGASSESLIHHAPPKIDRPADSGIFAFTIQSGTGVLTEISGSPFPASGPFVVSALQPANRMVIDQMNHFLYGSTSAGIAAFSIDQNSGALTAIAGSPFAANLTHPAAIVITPDNRYLYEARTEEGSNFANDGNLYGYSLDQSTGTLTALTGSPFPVGCPSPGVNVPGHGGVPDNMTISSAGKFLYFANCGTYSIDATTGALTETSNVSPGDWQLPKLHRRRGRVSGGPKYWEPYCRTKLSRDTREPTVSKCRIAGDYEIVFRRVNCQ